MSRTKIYWVKLWSPLLSRQGYDVNISDLWDENDLQKLLAHMREKDWFETRHERTIVGAFRRHMTGVD